MKREQKRRRKGRSPTPPTGGPMEDSRTHRSRTRGDELRRALDEVEDEIEEVLRTNRQ